MHPVLNPPPAALGAEKRLSRATSFTQMERLPDVVQSHILSFASPESVSGVSRNTDRLVKGLLMTSHYREMLRAAPNTLIGRLLQKEPWLLTDQSIKKVRRWAIENVESEKPILDPDDWKEMGIRRDRNASTLSYSQMNQIDAKIKESNKDLLLINAFGSIIYNYADIRLSISELPWLWNTSGTHAKLIRDWLDNPDNQALIATIDDYTWGAKCIMGLPLEFLQFPNMPINHLLMCAASDMYDDPEAICKILESAGPIDPKFMGEALGRSIKRGNHRISLALARSGRETAIGMSFILDPIVESGLSELLQVILEHHQPNDVWLSALLHQTIRYGNFDMVQLIIDSPHEISDDSLRAKLIYAACFGIRAPLRSILQSSRELTPATTDMILGISLDRGFPDIAKEILLSNRRISGEELCSGFKLSLRRGYREVAELILASPYLSENSLQMAREIAQSEHLAEK